MIALEPLQSSILLSNQLNIMEFIFISIKFLKQCIDIDNSVNKSKIIKVMSFH